MSGGAEGIPSDRGRQDQTRPELRRRGLAPFCARGPTAAFEGEIQRIVPPGGYWDNYGSACVSLARACVVLSSTALSTTVI